MMGMNRTKVTCSKKGDHSKIVLRGKAQEIVDTCGLLTAVVQRTVQNVAPSASVKITLEHSDPVAVAEESQC